HRVAVVTLAQEQVEQAVAVEVDGRETATLVAARAAPAILGHVGELAATVVAKKDTRRCQGAVLAVNVVRDVQIEPAVVGEIDEKGAAAHAGSAQLLLVVETELPLVVAQEHAGLGASIVESSHEQVWPAVAVHIAPGNTVAADAGNVREQAGLVADVAEHE